MRPADAMRADDAGLRRLRALAVLRPEVPLLRLQQPRARRRHRRGALSRRLPARAGACRAAHRAAPVVEHLLRRRHAVADAAGDRRRHPRSHRRAVERRRRTPRSRSRPIPAASRRRAFAAIARPASTASRSACSRSTTTSCKRSAACTRPPRRRRRSRSRARRSSASPSISSTRAPGRRAAAWRAELREALAIAGQHLSLYQLTIEPETPFAALHARGKLVVPDERGGATLYEMHAGDDRGGGAAGLRDLQPRRARRGEPPQPPLLALRRIRRRRARRARAP